MRVTQKMLNTQMLRNLSNNLGRMDKLQNDYSSGTKIHAPSDDPVGIGFSLRYRSELAANEQYQKNVDSALSWLEYMDTTLYEVNDIVQRIRELTVRGANGSNPDIAMESIESEVRELYDQLIETANSKFNGKYIFNGQRTDVPPYTDGTAPLDQTDTGYIEFEIGSGMTMPVNLTGKEVFGDAGATDNLFRIVQDLQTELNNSNYNGVSSILDRIDTRLDILLKMEADIGARINRLQLAEKRLNDQSVNLQKLISKTEDADIAQVITNLKTEENVYQASLSAGARIIQPSLVDFLR